MQLSSLDKSIVKCFSVRWNLLKYYYLSKPFTNNPRMARIGTGQTTALFEAFSAAVALLPQKLCNGLILVGGTSLLYLGSDRKTEDVDIAITVPTLHAFHAATFHDPRFKKGQLKIGNTPQASGTIVRFEFLFQGGGFAPIIRAAREIVAGSGMRAGLGELTIMKVRT
jgi:hypothetical protein